MLRQVHLYSLRLRTCLLTASLSRLVGGQLTAWYCARIISCRALRYEPSRPLRMPSAMNYVAPRGVSVVLGGLLVVVGGMLEVF